MLVILSASVGLRGIIQYRDNKETKGFNLIVLKC